MEERKLKGIKTFIIGEAIVLASLLITILSLPGIIVSIIGLFSMANINDDFRKARNWRLLELGYVFILAIIIAILTVVMGVGSLFLISILAATSAVIAMLTTINYLNGFNKLATDFGENEMANNFSNLKKIYTIVTVVVIALVLLNAIVPMVEILANLAGYVSAGVSLFIVLNMYTFHDKLKNKTNTSSTNYAYNIDNNQNTYYNNENNANYQPVNTQLNPEINNSSESAKENRDEIYKKFEG